MGVNDFLVVLTIVLAMLSIAVSTDRKIWSYKISFTFIIILVIVSLGINYLIFFPWFLHHGLCIQSLCIDGYPRPSTWAYIITLLTIALLIYVIAIRKTFPSSRHESLLSYYKELIERNPILLIDYLTTYHKKDITKHINLLNKSYDEEKSKKSTPMDFSFEEDKEQKKQHKPSLTTKIFTDIILNKRFIQKTIEIAPSFFLERTYTLRHKYVIDYESAVEIYFRLLIQSKNPELINELNYGYNDKDRITYDLSATTYVSKITYSPLYCSDMKVFRAFGEEALRETSTANDIFNKKRNEWLTDKYHKTNAFLCLRFYDIIIREAINNKHKQLIDETFFLYPYYLKLICDEIIKNPSNTFKDDYAAEFVDDVLDNITSWLCCLKEKNETIFAKSLLDIYYQIVLSLHKDKEKIKYFAQLYETLFDLSRPDETDVATIIYDFIKQHPTTQEYGIAAFYEVDTVKYCQYYDYYNKLQKFLAHMKEKGCFSSNQICNQFSNCNNVCPYNNKTFQQKRIINESQRILRQPNIRRR